MRHFIENDTESYKALQLVTINMRLRCDISHFSMMMHEHCHVNMPAHHMVSIPTQ